MAIFIDGTTKIKGLTIDTSNVMKKGYVDNSILVYSADKEIFKDGIIGDGVTISGFVKGRPARTDIPDVDVLYINSGLPNYWYDDPTTGTRYVIHRADSKSGTITFDFTDFSSITVKGYFCGWARFADGYIDMGIDSSLVRVHNGIAFSLEYFTKTYDASSLSGNHSISGFTWCYNKSDEVDVSPFNYLCIQEIIANT